MNIVVYAIGGNALSPPKLAESDPHHSNEQVLSNVISDILWLRNEGYKVVMTHGNGPQVGALMMDALPTEQKTLDQWVAVTQDTIGHELSQPLEEALASSSSSMQSLVMIVKTRVLVDAADPSFEHPTKPIGPILTETDVTTRDWDIANTMHGPRRVVASPSPLRIIEIDTIRNLVGENGSSWMVSLRS